MEVGEDRVIRIGETAAAVELKLRQLGFTVNATEVDGVGIEPSPEPEPLAPSVPPPDAPVEKPHRHRAWVPLRKHVYICAGCGTGKENSQTDRGRWITTYHTPDGRSQVLSRTPPCVPGPRTAAALRKHAAAIAAADVEKKGKRPA